ncbi:MAG TPA: integrase arm-type DNA-binding domain-containing protein [Geminicoccus sp.]|uniref:tyrosine-type recombinase/integrase n=1 Tax=Geminicoccus sp. TaxID=2024832 RepID=UPI002C3FE46E|nr:integrase arm-type DNA-binding domain-containing protein [Geminicoccus sp.]HWL69657.1 integrase arm-type DNA-binding domain-containing protein [Geminicoccus sp.]
MTVQRIEAAVCPPNRSEMMLWDADVPGLALRVYPNGRKVFLIQFRSDGGGRSAPTRRVTLGAHPSISLSDARAAARKRFGELAVGRDPARERDEGRRREKAMLQPALDAYECSLQRRGLVRTKQTLSTLRRHLLDVLGNCDLATLDRRKLVDRFNTLEREGKPGAATDLRARVSVFLSWAANEGLIQASPLAGWRKPRSSRAEKVRQVGRALEDAELPVLWQAAGAGDDPIFTALVRFVILTGVRKSEAASACWHDMVLEGNDPVWTIPADITKQGRAHRVPLTKEMIDLLRAVPRTEGVALVFPGRGGKPISGWTQRLRPIFAATTTAKLPPWTMHDLRRTYRTGLARLGVPDAVAELLVGHAVADPLMRAYQRDDAWQSRRQAQERWSRHVLGLIAGRVPDVGMDSNVALPREIKRA